MIYIGAPVYNEGLQLSSFLLRAKKVCPNIIVVDDGSTDVGTQILDAFAVRNDIILVRHEYNKGLGEALKTLIKSFLSIAQKGDWLVIMDADNTHDPEQIAEMTPFLNEYDVIIASRWVDNWSAVGVPRYRMIGSRIINASLSLLTHIPDNTCGYRAYSYESLYRLVQHNGDNFISESGFVSTFEVLYKLKKLDPPLKIKTIPLRLDFMRRTSKSKLNIKRELLMYSKFILQQSKKR